MRMRSSLLLSAAVGLFLSALQGPAQAPAPPKRPPAHGGAPTVSPDGSKIAFLSDREGTIDVYVIGADGQGEKRLTQTIDPKGHPDWSSDGKRIRFASFANDTSRIFEVAPDGKNLKSLGSVPGRAATLSPDGTRALYWTGTWTAVKLFVSGLSGDNPKQLTDGSGVAWNTRWSPDGKWIAFTGRDARTEILHVFVMGPDGSSLRQVTNFPIADGQAQVPAWSPDGKQLAVQAGDKNVPAHIWIVDAATGTARKLNPHDTYVDEVPSWFPDGKRIAFQSNRTGTMEVWVMNADGTAPRQVTH